MEVFAAAAGQFGAPYPALVALAGAALALLPGVPTLVLDPELALFVAPVLVHAAFDASLSRRQTNVHSPCAVDCGMVVDCFVRRVLISGLLAGIVASSIASAGLGRWTTSGPEGATVLSLAVDPADPAVVYAGTSAGGVFRSADSAAHWHIAGLGGFSVSIIVTDPSDEKKSMPRPAAPSSRALMAGNPGGTSARACRCRAETSTGSSPSLRSRSIRWFPPSSMRALRRPASKEP
jgi:hypothetical protein